jgi:hypothetical protein
MQSKANAIPDAADDRLIADPKVAERYDVHTKTIGRWDADPDLGFPKPVVINKRNYRRLSDLMIWERAQTAKVAAAR